MAIYEPLDLETERALLPLVRAGDRGAAERLIRASAKQVWHVAYRASRAFPHLGLDDAWGEASLGVFRCLKKHDGRYTFARLAVHGAWHQCCRAQRHYRRGFTPPARRKAAAGTAGAAGESHCVGLSDVPAADLTAPPPAPPGEVPADRPPPLPRGGGDRECYDALVRWVHPRGVTCPRCGAGGDFHERARGDDPVVSYGCKWCRQCFTAFTGTPLAGSRRPPRELVAFLSGLADGVPRGRLARELGWHPEGARRLCRALMVEADAWKSR